MMFSDGLYEKAHILNIGANRGFSSESCKVGEIFFSVIQAVKNQAAVI